MARELGLLSGGDDGHAVPNVTVTVSAVFNPDSGGAGSVQAQIAALSFDAYDSR